MMYHETGIDCGPYVSAKRVPTFRVEEVPEFLEVIVDQEFGGPVVEPGIELVDDGFVSDNTEDPDQTGDRTYQKQDCYADCWLPFVKRGVRL